MKIKTLFNTPQQRPGLCYATFIANVFYECKMQIATPDPYALLSLLIRTTFYDLPEAAPLCLTNLTEFCINIASGMFSGNQSLS